MLNTVYNSIFNVSCDDKTFAIFQIEFFNIYIFLE